MTSRHVILRLWDKLDYTDPAGCLRFTGAVDSSGYGSIKHAGRTRSAHRVAFEFEYGPVPDALELDHLCRNRRCCNAEHLEPVTHQINVDRGRRGKGYGPRERTHCAHGHAFTPDNTIVTPTQRRCRICERAKHRRYRQRQREEAAA